MAETENESVQEEKKQNTNAITEASNILAQIKEQNEILRANVLALQEMKATEMLSGSANAGQEVRIKTQDELDAEQARRYLEGSGYEDIQL